MHQRRAERRGLGRSEREVASPGGVFPCVQLLAVSICPMPTEQVRGRLPVCEFFRNVNDC